MGACELGSVEHRGSQWQAVGMASGNHALVCGKAEAVGQSAAWAETLVPPLTANHAQLMGIHKGSKEVGCEQVSLGAWPLQWPAGML